MVELEEITIINAPIERCFDLARSVEVHLEGNVHYGESAIAEGGITSGLLSMGERVTWRARHFYILQRLTSEITRYNRPHYFQDTMISGAFRFMRHDHYFQAVNDEVTQMRDVFQFEAPIPVLGLIVEKMLLRRYMQELLRERNAAVKVIAESEEWHVYIQ